MNTETLQQQDTPLTTGERLRLAREQLGLSQTAVAERLCLKVSTVRDIEEDRTADLAATFIRGYIRSYARLVHIPEAEILPNVDKQPPIKRAKIKSIQHLSSFKRRKKRDGWLMAFTWLIIILILGLTGAWWWQNHKAQQEKTTAITDNNGAIMANAAPDATGNTNHNNTHANNPNNTHANNPNQTDKAKSTEVMLNLPPQPAPAATQPDERAAPTAAPANTAPLPQNQPNAANPPAAAPALNTSSLPPQPATVSQPQHTPATPAASNELSMKFSQACWLEITDSRGKKLFSGTKTAGERLALSGQPPYRLIIGAPGAVQISYQGKAVSLSQFAQNKVARLTIGTAH